MAYEGLNAQKGCWGSPGYSSQHGTRAKRDKLQISTRFLKLAAKPTRVVSGIQPFPVLLMPVYRGGELFKEAIDSVIPCLSWFGRVVISLNGDDAGEDQNTALALKNYCDLSILRTKEILTWVQHLRFITKELSDTLSLPADTQLFILCHDDRLHQPGFNALDLNLWRSWRHNWISLGDYLVFGDDSSSGKHRNECWFARYDKRNSRPKAAFLLTQYQRHDDPFTNFSGMRMSLAVLNSTIRFFSLTGSRTGMRLEYSLIVNRRIQEVKNFAPPLVAVREHTRSAGAQVTRKDFIASELRYAIWMWVNCGSLSTAKKLYLGQYGLVGVLNLVRISLLHRYYEFLGWTRWQLAKRGLITHQKACEHGHKWDKGKSF